MAIFSIKSQEINSYRNNFKELVHPNKLGTPQAWVHISTNRKKIFISKNAIWGLKIAIFRIKSQWINLYSSIGLHVGIPKQICLAQKFNSSIIFSQKRPIFLGFWALYAGYDTYFVKKLRFHLFIYMKTLERLDVKNMKFWKLVILSLHPSL